MPLQFLFWVALMLLVWPGDVRGQRTLPEGTVMGEFRSLTGVRELSSRALIVVDSTGVTLVNAAGTRQHLELGAGIRGAPPRALRGDSTALYDATFIAPLVHVRQG